MGESVEGSWPWPGRGGGPILPPIKALSSCCCCSADHTEGSGAPFPNPAAANGDELALFILREPAGGVGSDVSSPTNCLKFGA